MSLKKRIEAIMNEVPSCKDSDTELCMNVWKRECEELGHDLTKLSALEFLHLESSGCISKKQTILRSRRNLNQKKSDTRGKSYKSNLKKKKPTIRNMHSLKGQIQNPNSDRGEHQFSNHVNMEKRKQEQNVGGFDHKLSILTG